MKLFKKVSFFTVIAIALFAFSTNVFASVMYYTVSTSSGVPVNMRSGPGTSYPIMASIPSGTKVPVYCYKTGTTVTGKYGTSNIWDQVAYTVNGVTNIGYVSDTYVYTGSDSPVVIKCD